MAQDDDAFVGLRPGLHRENRFEGVAADDDCVNAGDEFVIAVRFAAVGGEKVELAVWPGDEAVEAGADEDGDFH